MFIGLFVCTERDLPGSPSKLVNLDREPGISEFEFLCKKYRPYWVRFKKGIYHVQQYILPIMIELECAHRVCLHCSNTKLSPLPWRIPLCTSTTCSYLFIPMLLRRNRRKQYIMLDKSWTLEQLMWTHPDQFLQGKIKKPCTLVCFLWVPGHLLRPSEPGILQVKGLQLFTRVCHQHSHQSWRHQGTL